MSTSPTPAKHQDRTEDSLVPGARKNQCLAQQSGAAKAWCSAQRRLTFL